MNGKKRTTDPAIHFAGSLAGLTLCFPVILTLFSSPVLPPSFRLSAALSSSSPSPVQFSNVTHAAGIHFQHFKGSNGTSTILEEAGPGVCVADFDADSYQDIYFVNGRDLYRRGISVRNALNRNLGTARLSM